MATKTISVTRKRSSGFFKGFATKLSENIFLLKRVSEYSLTFNKIGD